MAALFEAAADYITVNGWLSDDAGFDGSARSIDGAMNSVLDCIDSDVEKALAVGHDACRVFEDIVGSNVCHWNDLTCKDGAEAERMLRALAGVLNGGAIPVAA